MPTTEDVLAYLGIDYADEVVTRNVERAMATAKQVLLGSVGEDVETYLPDVYSERGLSAKVSNATRQMVNTMEWQLRLELARAKEQAGGDA